MASVAWFKFFPAEYLSDSKVRMLSHAHRGMLLELWCICARDGFACSDQKTFQKLFQISPKAAREVHSALAPFFVEEDGRFVSPRLEKEALAYQTKVSQLHDSATKGGKASAKKRQANGQANASDPIQANGQANASGAREPIAQRNPTEAEAEAETEEEREESSTLRSEDSPPPTPRAERRAEASAGLEPERLNPEGQDREGVDLWDFEEAMRLCPPEKLGRMTPCIRIWCLILDSGALTSRELRDCCIAHFRSFQPADGKPDRRQYITRVDLWLRDGGWKPYLPAVRAAIAEHPGTRLAERWGREPMAPEDDALALRLGMLDGSPMPGVDADAPDPSDLAPEPIPLATGVSA